MPQRKTNDLYIKNEYDYLLHLLRCAVQGTVPQAIPEGLSMEAVLKYGVYHDVANIAFLALEKLPTPPEQQLYERWKQEYMIAVARDAVQNKARADILAALHAHGIDTLEVQGTVVKQYYPQRHLRMMGDIDVIIPFEKMNEAEGIMQSLGYETVIAHNGTEVHATRGQLFIELHTEFFFAFHIVHAVLHDPFSYAARHEDHSATVTDTVFYLFHLLHTIKHAWEYSGVGIRRIIDLFYLENALRDTADFAYIDSVLKEFDLYEIKEKLVAVKDHWFCGMEPDNDLLEFEEDILESGSQGTERLLYKNKFERERKAGKHFVKLKYVLDFIFPKKEEIYQAYPFCEKHHLPTVLCWIHRWIFSVFSSKKWKNVWTMLSRAKIR